MKKGMGIILSILSLGMFTGTANATLFTFDLKNSIRGGERPPNYGLRLDGLYSGKSNDIYTFAFIDVDMTVDSEADTASIGGTLLGGTEGKGELRNTDWLFEFTYTNLEIDATDGSWSFNNGTSDGTGSISRITGPSTIETFALAQYRRSNGFSLGGGCRPGDGPWCGSGWLNHSITPGAPVSDKHLYSSDFLYSGTPVPEPSIIALFGAGIAGFGFARRRRQS